MRVIEVSSPSAHDRGQQYGQARSAPWKRLVASEFPDCTRRCAASPPEPYPVDGLIVHGNQFQAFVPPQLAAQHRPMPGWQPERVAELRAAFALTEGRS